MKRKQYMFMVISLVIGVYIGMLTHDVTNHYPRVPTQAVAATPTPDIYQLYLDTNKERTQVGLSPLVLDLKLTTSAEAKCHDMSVKNYWAHDAPDGTTWVSFIQKTTRYRQAGEILAQGYATAEGTTRAWMNSTDHK